MNPHQNWFRNIGMSFKKKKKEEGNLDISYNLPLCRGREGAVDDQVFLHPSSCTCPDAWLTCSPSLCSAIRGGNHYGDFPTKSCDLSPSVLSTASLIMCPILGSAQASQIALIVCEFWLCHSLSG